MIDGLEKKANLAQLLLDLAVQVLSTQPLRDVPAQQHVV